MVKTIRWQILKTCLLPWSESVMILFLQLSTSRTPLHLSLRHRPVHLLLPEGERCGAWLRQDGVFPRGESLQERHRRAISPGGHLDHVHEGQAQLLAFRRDPLLLQRAAEHLLPVGAGPHLWHLHHQCVSDTDGTYIYWSTSTSISCYFKIPFRFIMEVNVVSLHYIYSILLFTLLFIVVHFEIEIPQSSNFLTIVFNCQIFYLTFISKCCINVPIFTSILTNQLTKYYIFTPLQENQFHVILFFRIFGFCFFWQLFKSDLFLFCFVFFTLISKVWLFSLNQTCFSLRFPGWLTLRLL